MHEEEFDKIAKKLGSTFSSEKSRENDLFEKELDKAFDEIKEEKKEYEERNQERNELDISEFKECNEKIIDIKDKNEISVHETEKKEVVEDKKLIQNEFHNQIANINDVIITLKNGLKENSRASQFEAFAKIASTMNETLSKLAEFNLKVKDKENFLDDDIPKENKQTLIFNGNDVLDKIMELKKLKKGEKDDRENRENNG